ncbi:MAG: hypothetical protein O7B24_00330 [Alphaproteobacteria bacterium]|nr:hypothetical protein [Alphaproteobacteria bacterium]
MHRHGKTCPGAGGPSNNCDRFYRQGSYESAEIIRMNLHAKILSVVWPGICPEVTLAHRDHSAAGNDAFTMVVPNPIICIRAMYKNHWLAFAFFDVGKFGTVYRGLF